MEYIPRCFRKAVTTAGTGEQLTTADIETPAVLIQAEVSNTGQIYVGDSQVNYSATDASIITGVELDSGDSISFDIADCGEDAAINLSGIWLDAGVSGDGVWVTYLQEVR